MTRPSPRADALSTAWRAAFLACSWTWVIGMFFPVYLVRDFGWPGWLAFLVPNCLGAAGMGLALRRPGAGEALLARSPRAPRLFSLATIAFHLWFVAMLFALVGAALGGGNADWWGVAASCVTLVGGLGLAGLPARAWPRVTVATYALSIALAGAAVALGWGAVVSMPPAAGSRPPLELLFALPALALGFALCPYLDLTFHRVRREAPGRTGTAAFAIGFLALFPPLVGFTLLYAGAFSGGAPGPLLLLVMAHILAQSVFTVGAHARELFETAPAPGDPRARAARLALLAAGAAVCALAAFVPWSSPGLAPGTRVSRTVYESYLSLYGLVFPALALCVLFGDPGRRGWRAFAAVLAVAGPMFAVGYLGQRHAWLLPAAVVMAAGWWWARRGAGTKTPAA